MEITPILEDGKVESLRESELGLLRALKMPQLRLLDTMGNLMHRACDAQGLKISPTQEILDAYRKSKTGWTRYEGEFRKLFSHRWVESAVSQSIIPFGRLRCSEETPDQCHRRIVAEYLLEKRKRVEITHLR